MTRLSSSLHVTDRCGNPIAEMGRDLPETKVDIKGTSLLVSLAFYELEN